MGGRVWRRDAASAGTTAGAATGQLLPNQHAIGAAHADAQPYNLQGQHTVARPQPHARASHHGTQHAGLRNGGMGATAPVHANGGAAASGFTQIAAGRGAAAGEQHALKRPMAQAAASGAAAVGAGSSQPTQQQQQQQTVTVPSAEATSTAKRLHTSSKPQNDAPAAAAAAAAEPAGPDASTHHGQHHPPRKRQRTQDSTHPGRAATAPQQPPHSSHLHQQPYGTGQVEQKPHANHPTRRQQQQHHSQQQQHHSQQQQHHSQQQQQGQQHNDISGQKEATKAPEEGGLQAELQAREAAMEALKRQLQQKEAQLAKQKKLEAARQEARLQQQQQQEAALKRKAQLARGFKSLAAAAGAQPVLAAGSDSSAAQPAVAAVPAADEWEVARVLDCKNDYECLKLHVGASLAQVRHRYRQMAMALHPDKCKLDGAASAFQRLKKAYDHLCSVTS